MTDKISGPGFSLHHLGIAVADLDQSVDFYSQAMGLKTVSGPFDDPIQKVRVSFLAEAGREVPNLELICPLNEESPINGYLKKGIGAYHVCYEVSNITATLNDLRAKGCLIISQPVPAVAFSGRKIAWCFTPTKHLVELLER